MKMVLTRGESVQQNTSLEGAPVIEQQLRTLKDSWASLLSACIHCKRYKNIYILKISNTFIKIVNHQGAFQSQRFPKLVFWTVICFQHANKIYIDL